MKLDRCWKQINVLTIEMKKKISAKDPSIPGLRYLAETELFLIIINNYSGCCGFGGLFLSGNG